MFLALALRRVAIFPHNPSFFHNLSSSYSSYTRKYNPTKMGKNNRKGPSEDCLILPNHPRHTTAPIVDTHTHLVSTFTAYRQKYKGGKYETIYDLVRGLYRGKKVAALVDVWCEAPVQWAWKEIADSAITAEDRKDKWGDLEYWFVMGACTQVTVVVCALIVLTRCPSVSVPCCETYETT